MMFSLTDLAPGWSLASLSRGGQLILRAPLSDSLERGLSATALLTWQQASRSGCPGDEPGSGQAQVWAGVPAQPHVLRSVARRSSIACPDPRREDGDPPLNGRSVKASWQALI